MVKKTNKQNKRIKKEPNFIYRNFLISLDYMKEAKNYFWFSLGLFFIIAVFGYIFPVFFVDEILKIIAELVKQTEGLGALELMRFIFTNNVQSALIGMILGVFFAIAPLFIILVNGYILGFVANKSVGVEGFLVLWRLLPHGIFEIPAIIISVGLGIRLGMFLLVYKGKNKKKEFLRWLLSSIKVFVLIVIPLLVIAGIIEGMLIYFLG